MAIELPPAATSVLEEYEREAQSGEAAALDLSRLRSVCPDPLHLYVMSPVPARLVDVARMYASEDDPAAIPGLLRSLTRRCAEERWAEQRAVFQARRFQATQDAMVAAEAYVMASMATSFHSGRIRSLWARWESLSAAVENELSEVAGRQRNFGADLRDMCRELDSVEHELVELLPKLRTGEEAQRLISGSRVRREELIDDVASKLPALAASGIGGSPAIGNVLSLVRERAKRAG